MCRILQPRSLHGIFGECSRRLLRLDGYIDLLVSNCTIPGAAAVFTAVNLHVNICSVQYRLINWCDTCGRNVTIFPGKLSRIYTTSYFLLSLFPILMHSSNSTDLGHCQKSYRDRTMDFAESTVSTRRYRCRVHASVFERMALQCESSAYVGLHSCR